MTKDEAVTGEDLKRQARHRLERVREAFVRRARRALLEKLLRDGVATGDDVQDAAPCPPGVDPKVYGVVPGALAKRQIIGRAGYTSSRRPVAHARPVTKWKLLDAAAAQAWLLLNPEIPGEVPA